MTPLLEIFARLRFEDAPSRLTVAFGYQPMLTALAFAVAVLGSFTFLQLYGRSQLSDGWAGVAWRIASAVMLALTAWAAQFISMLAFDSPLVQGLSINAAGIAAVFALLCGVAAGVIVGEKPGLGAAFAIGAIVAAGMIGMHIWSMAGLYLDAIVNMRPIGLGLAAFGSFLLAFVVVLQLPLLTSWRQCGVLAVAMAFCIGGLQALRNAVTTLSPAPEFSGPATVADHGAIALGVAAASLMVFAVALALHMRRPEPAPEPASLARTKAASRPLNVRETAEQNQVDVIEIPAPISRAPRTAAPRDTR